MTSPSAIRPAVPEDLPDVLRLVRELASYEKEPDAAVATLDDFAAVLFPDHGHPSTFCHLAVVEGTVVGIAAWFLTFSTWTGQHGIWLEDLYVEPAHRGSGLGKGLLAALAGVAVANGWTRVEWWVLNWNTPSIGFYESLGAVAQNEWTTFRLDGPALARFSS